MSGPIFNSLLRTGFRSFRRFSTHYCRLHAVHDSTTSDTCLAITIRAGDSLDCLLFFLAIRAFASEDVEECRSFVWWCNSCKKTLKIRMWRVKVKSKVSPWIVHWFVTDSSPLFLLSSEPDRLPSLSLLLDNFSSLAASFSIRLAVSFLILSASFSTFSRSFSFCLASLSCFFDFLYCWLAGALCGRTDDELPSVPSWRKEFVINKIVNCQMKYLQSWSCKGKVWWRRKSEEKVYQVRNPQETFKV